MNQRGAEIPGLFSSDQNKPNIDWSSDNLSQEQQHGGADPAADGSNQNQNNMILLGNNTLLGDLGMEKDNLDKSFVHSHRLLDIGKKLPFLLMHTF